MTLENENGFLNPTTKQIFRRNKSMTQKVKEKERVEAGKVVVCPKCGRVEFAVVRFLYFVARLWPISNSF